MPTAAAIAKFCGETILPSTTGVLAAATGRLIPVLGGGLQQPEQGMRGVRPGTATLIQPTDGDRKAKNRRSRKRQAEGDGLRRVHRQAGQPRTVRIVHLNCTPPTNDMNAWRTDSRGRTRDKQHVPPAVKMFS
jgi:hypothetical protein